LTGAIVTIGVVTMPFTYDPESKGRWRERERRAHSSPPIFVSPNCGLCGEPLEPGRYVCATPNRRSELRAGCGPSRACRDSAGSG
jgi:hypothetical protein